MSAQKEPFKKPPLSLGDQVKLLAERGMEIPDATRAAHYLQFIGYYRLSGYYRFFASNDDPKRQLFRTGTSFDDVLALYIFDRKLRVLLMDAFERVEIAIKAVMSHEGCLEKGVFWLCEAANFDHGSHEKIMEVIKEALGDPDGAKAQHVFISHFYNKYSDPMPPSWMTVETLSFGNVSRIFAFAKGELQTRIAKPFGVNRSVLASWLHALSVGRNICAHHSRVWNRTFTIKPQIPHKYAGDWSAQDKLYVLCCIVHHIMTAIGDTTDWAKRLRTLINERGDLPLASMGFPVDWENKDFWGFKPAL